MDLSIGFLSLEVLDWRKARVTLPHRPACRAGASRTSDVGLAGRLGAAPSGLGFGDPAAQAGARPKAGAAAGNRTRTFSLARRCSAAKPQPRKLKGAGSTLSAPPARALSTKIKHLLAILRSQPAVSRRLFRCLWAHLLGSPLTANPGQTHVTCWMATGRRTPPAENLGSPTSQFVLASRTSARCRVCSHRPCRSFRLSASVSLVPRANKKPRSPSVSRAGKSWSSRDALYLLTFLDPAGGYVPGLDRNEGGTHNRSTMHDVSSLGRPSPVVSRLRCSCRFASNVGDV